MKKLTAIIICLALLLSVPTVYATGEETTVPEVTATEAQPAEPTTESVSASESSESTLTTSPSTTAEPTAPTSPTDTTDATEPSSEARRIEFEGNIGEGLEFVLDKETAVLHISGDGRIMKSFSQGEAPWYPYASIIRGVVFKTKNLTHISRYAFENVEMETLTLPDTVIAVGQGAFRNAKVDELIIPNKKVAVFDSADTLPEKGLIRCYKSADIHAYAEKYKRNVYYYITKITHPDKSEILMLGEKYTPALSITPVEAEHNIKWHTTDSKIASITQKGVVTAKKAGICYVYASSKDNPKIESKERVKIIVTEYKFTQSIQTLNNCYKYHTAISPKGIVVHSMSVNNTNAQDYATRWNTPKPEGREVAVHGFLGKGEDGTIQFIQTLPFTMACWGVGSGSKGSYNFDPGYIQFELCEDNRTSQTYFTQVYNQATDLCAYLCLKYNFSTKTIVGHYEANALGYGSPHGDPQVWFRKFGYSMKKFRETVKKKIHAIDPDPDLTTGTKNPKHLALKDAKLYKKAVADDYGDSVKVLKTIKQGEKLSFICDIDNGWSKVKYDRKTGYVRNDVFEREYLSVFYKKKLLKKTNLYTQPTAKKKFKAKSLSKGTKVKIVSVITKGKKKGWTLITRNKKDYYIKTKYHKK